MNITNTDQQWVDQTWEKIAKKLSRTAVSAKNKIPYTTKDGVYDDHGSKDQIHMWTNGFWAGMMWLMYGATKDDRYKEAAEISEKLLDQNFENIAGTHHDVGFMWHLSAGANYRLTGNEQSKNRDLLAANLLAGRYNLKGGFIRAWNGNWHENDNRGWAIIDCMMNIPLLYWASDVTEDDRFRSIAMSHADKTMTYHVREDGSVHHIVNYDIETGEVRSIEPGQGYAVGSSWSRGQAWGLYGFTLSYIHTGAERYLNTAKRIAHYFIAATCDDYLPKCDFRSPAEPVIYDSTAGMIAASGLIELAKQVPEHEQAMYLNAALKMLKAAEEKFANWSDTEDSILTGGTEAYTFGSKEIPIIYGDFYFVEALSKLKGFGTFLW